MVAGLLGVLTTEFAAERVGRRAPTPEVSAWIACGFGRSLCLGFLGTQRVRVAVRAPFDLRHHLPELVRLGIREADVVAFRFECFVSCDVHLGAVPRRCPRETPGEVRAKGVCDIGVRKLETYLNDHLAGSIVALDLARRRASSQGDDEIGTFLRTFAQEIERDQQALRTVMQTLDASPRMSRELFGAATSWVDTVRGALDMPGAPNLVRDIEVLIMGVRGKELLWRSLDGVGATTNPPIVELEARARRQIAGLEKLHARAVQLELGRA
jgi:hypothetical protein